MYSMYIRMYIGCSILHCVLCMHRYIHIILYVQYVHTYVHMYVQYIIISIGVVAG